MLECYYLTGYGTGGPFIEIGGINSEEECTNACFKRKETDLAIRGAAYYGQSTRCVCEKGTNERHKNHWRGCIFIISKYSYLF